LSSSRGTLSSSVSVSALYFDGVLDKLQRRCARAELARVLLQRRHRPGVFKPLEEAARKRGLARVARTKAREDLLEPRDEAQPVLAELMEDTRGVAVLALGEGRQHVLDGDLVAARVERAADAASRALTQVGVRRRTMDLGSTSSAMGGPSLGWW
jgi:hypothetical protein